MVDLTDVVAVTRGLVDIDSTTGREGDCVLWMATLLSEAGYGVVEQVVEGSRRNIYAASARPTSSCRRISIACRRFSPATSTATGCSAAGRAMRRELPRARSPQSRSCAARGSRTSGCCSSSAKSAAAMVRRPRRRWRRDRSFSSTASRPTIVSALARAARCAITCARRDAPRIRHFRSSACRRSTSSSTRC